MAGEEQSCERLADDLFRVSVPNHVGASGQPTNVYIVGQRAAVIIDAGSNDEGVAVTQALDHFGVCDVDRIILTHAHQDHAGSAPAIRAATGAGIFVHPRDRHDPAVWNDALDPVELLHDGQIIEAGRFRFEILETPGHAPGHVSLYEPTLKALFAGDLISGNGTIAVVPPRGSMREYMTSLRRVAALEVDVIYPGHGPLIPNGNERIAQYIARRESREQEVYAAVAAGLDTSEVVTGLLYPDIRPRHRRAAEGTVRAHLLHLIEQQKIRIIEDGADCGPRYATLD